MQAITLGETKPATALYTVGNFAKTAKKTNVHNLSCIAKVTVSVTNYSSLGSGTTGLQTR